MQTTTTFITTQFHCWFCQRQVPCAARSGAEARICADCAEAALAILRNGVGLWRKETPLDIRSNISTMSAADPPTL